MGTIHDRAIICSEHFDKSEYTVGADGKMSLSKDAEPTLFGVTQRYEGTRYEVWTPNVAVISITVSRTLTNCQ